VTARILWPADLRKRVRERRGFVSGKKHKPADLRAMFEKLRASYRQWSVGWERGIERTEPDLAERMRSVRDAFVEGSDPPMHFDMNLATAMVVACVGHTAAEDTEDPFVMLWVATEGVPFAVEAVVRCRMLGIEYAENAGNYNQRARRLVEKTPNDLDWPSRSLFETLRVVVARADDATYQAARERAASLRGTVPLCLRCALSFAFPSEPAWARADAEAILESAKPGATLPWHGQMLLASLDDPALVEKLKSTGNWPWFAWDYGLEFVATMGERAVPTLDLLLREGLRRAREAGRQRIKAIARALSIIEDLEVARILAPLLPREEVRGVVSDYLRRFPHLAELVLPPLVKEKGRVTELATQLLIGARKETLEPDLEEARVDELPTVLVDSPWRKPGERRAPIVIENVTPIESASAIHWRTPREKDTALVRHAYWTWETMDPEREAKYLETLNKAIEEKKIGTVPFAYELAHQEKKMRILREELRLKLWNENDLKVFQRYSLPATEMLARHGIDSLPGLLHFVDLDFAAGFELLTRVSTSKIAPLMARSFHRKKALRSGAQIWLLRDLQATTLGVVPLAVGPLGRDREASEATLLLLASRGHAESIRSITARYGAEVVRAVEEILTRDPLDLLPKTTPKLPAIWTPRAWPRPRLASGRALSFEAIDRIGEMLTLTRLDPPYAGFVPLREACERRSLGEFTWAMFTAWLLAGTPSQHEWMLESLAHLGDDEIARKLVPFAREWRLRGERKRAHKAIEILGSLAVSGSEPALLQLGVMARGRYEDMRTRAQARMHDLADLRGMSREELADRMAPDLDLDPDGSRRLDFGSRAFRVGFDEHLQPFVRDTEGKRLASLPRVSKDDDVELASRANRIWKTLRSDAKAFAQSEIQRFESTLRQRRRWSVADFESLVLGHPLLVHLARRLVWGIYRDRELESAPTPLFRVAEDRTFADVDDRPLTLPERDAFVGLVHPLELGEAPQQAWSTLFGDYEILQPFDQLGRVAFRATKQELDAPTLDRFKGTLVSPGKMLALEYRGWSRAAGQQVGSVSLELPGGLALHLSITPGFDPRAIKSAKEQRVHVVWLASGSERMAFRTLDRFTFSEIVRDLESVRGSTSG